ncbi:MAG TPA: hypothetical protein DEO60_09730 [Bacteroidales bacterium]|nr:hypothetical protein [Bacteroidales bacterium]HBZ21398.1 hypothetical protein [Bacteroidales bacterium]
MKKKTKLYLLVIACILMLLAMFVLPIFIKPGQSIIRNTISDLGAQNSAGAWIINSILVVVAFSSLISVWGCFKGFAFQRVILLFFVISIVLSAFFNSAPVNPSVPCNISEDGWHKYFTGITWIAFTILTFSTAMILKKQNDKSLNLVTAISVILLSLLSSEAEQTAGVWQRLLYIISFGWLIYTLKTIE